jgi:hypothetical protein
VSINAVAIHNPKHPKQWNLSKIFLDDKIVLVHLSDLWYETGSGPRRNFLNDILLILLLFRLCCCWLIQPLDLLIQVG